MYKISILKSENFHNTLCLILISLLPLSLLIGSLVINIFCISIIIIFLFESFKERNFDFLKSYEFLILLIFWFFLLINTFLSTSFENSVGRGFGFARFILLVFALRYYFGLNNQKYFKFIQLSWLIIFLIVTFDLLFESYFGFNTLGFKSSYQGRLSGFLNDELKIGGYYYGFVLLTATYILINHKKYFYISFLIFILTALLIGERANFLKILLMSIPFIIFLNYGAKIKAKYFLIVIIFSILTTINYKPEFKKRFYYDFFDTKNQIISLQIFKKRIEKHYAHYSTSYKIFKDNFWFGVGLKNFRNESNKEKYLISEGEKYLGWSTHPHQIHFEFLSETGLVGYFVFFFFFMISFFKGLKNYLISKNLYSLCGSLFIFTTFLPLIPSGSFFTTYGATIFWINYSLIDLKKI